MRPFEAAARQAYPLLSPSFDKFFKISYSNLTKTAAANTTLPRRDFMKPTIHIPFLPDKPEQDAPGSRPGSVAKSLLCALLFTALSLFLSLLARRVPGFASFYSQYLYSLWRAVWEALCGWLPISLSELGLYVLAAGGILWMIKQRRHPLYVLSRLLCFASLLLLIFMLNCGINYYRTSFSQEEHFLITPTSRDELYALCEYLTEQVNTYAESQSAEAPSTPGSLLENLSYCLRMGRLGQAAMEALGESFPSLSGSYPAPKPLLFSRLLSIQQLCGIYSPFTIEACYNREMPRYNIPHTICHELSHRRGFMREDEANFIGYLACIRSDAPEVCYSGWLTGWVYATNALYAIDAESQQELYLRLDETAKRDLAWNTAFWNQFEGKVAETASQLNDRYLKANSQSDGVQSYGRMVDLMLSWYRASHSGSKR